MHTERILLRISRRESRTSGRTSSQSKGRLPFSALVATSITLTVLASSATAQVVPPGSTVAGKTIGDWTRDWALWAFTEPEETSPMFDRTGEFQQLNQDGPVWFVGSNFGGTSRRTFNVPSDMYVLTPVIIAWAGSSSEDDDLERQARDLADDNDSAFFSLDGFTILEDDLLANYREASGQFYYDLPVNSIADPPSGYVAFDGHWIMLEPLAPGEHILHTRGGASIDGFRAEKILTITAVDVGSMLRAGDADQDLDFDQLDLVQVQIAAKYLTAQPATWGEGDWDAAPGGTPGEPPVGNGLFDQLDIIAALGAGAYLTGPYGAIQSNGQPGDGQTSIVYNAGTGEVSVDAPGGVELTSINIDSAASIFTGAAAQNLGGSFDNDADNNVFKATFGSSFGQVAPSGLSEEFVLDDLTVIGSLAGGGPLGDVDLIYVPEPSTVVLGAFALLFVVWAGVHAKRGQMNALAVLLMAAMAMSASADTILIDDFNDGVADGWSTIDSTAGLPYGPGTFDAASEAYRLEGGGLVPEEHPAGGALLSIWDQSSDPIFSDGFVRATVRAETHGTIASVLLRASGTPESGLNGYLFFGSTAENGFLVNRIVDSQTAQHWFLNLPFGVDEDWHIEAGAIGDELSLKVWPVGEDEPEEPQLTLFDSTFDSGMLGVESNIHEDPFPGPARVSAVFDDIYFTFPDGVAVPGNLQAGDADQDLDFDQLDLVQVQVASKYLTGQSATWGEGDWDGAPGGKPNDPPVGNGLFDQFDIIAALASDVYLTGPYAAVQPTGRPGDGQTSIVYNASTGEVAVDAPAGVELTSINIDSSAGIFTGQPAANLGGSFDNDADGNIFKATFSSSFGSLSFGNVAQAGLSQEFVLGDVTVIGSLAGGGDLGEVDLIYVPEPGSALLLVIGAVIGLVRYKRAGAGSILRPANGIAVG